MNLRWRYLWPLVFTSLSLVVLCAYTAISLFHQQAAIAGELRENVASRRAATDLEECLLDINLLLKNRVEKVEALHQRAEHHFKQIDRFADQPEERVMA